MRAAGFNATQPLARLILTDKGLTLRLFGLVQLHSDLADVESAERVIGGLIGTPGLRLTLMDGRRFIFWCFHPDNALAALRDRDVQIIGPDGRPRRSGWEHDEITECLSVMLPTRCVSTGAPMI